MWHKLATEICRKWVFDGRKKTPPATSSAPTRSTSRQTTSRRLLSPQLRREKDDYHTRSGQETRRKKGFKNPKAKNAGFTRCYRLFNCFFEVSASNKYPLPFPQCGQFMPQDFWRGACMFLHHPEASKGRRYPTPDLNRALMLPFACIYF